MRNGRTHLLLAVLAAGSLAFLAGCTAHTGASGGSTAVRANPVVPLGEQPEPGQRSGPTETDITRPADSTPYTPPERTGALEPAPREPVELNRVPAEDLQRIHFAFDSYGLSSEARDVLGANAEVLGQRDTPRIMIEGHCDERGTSAYNLALGERRARSAYRYLADMGVPPAGMGVVSFGEERPLASEQNGKAWALNRRAEFVTALP